MNLILKVKERWTKTVHHSRYSVSNYGKIRNDETGLILKPGPNTGGYLSVNLGKGNSKAVHIIVKESFDGLYPKNKEIHHVDGDKKNNFLYNLRYVTRSEHMKLSYKYGNKKPVNHKGLRNPAAKLFDNEVKEIIKKYKSGKYTQQKLANMYGISRGHVSQLITGRRRTGENWRRLYKEI